MLRIQVVIDNEIETKLRHTVRGPAVWAQVRYGNWGQQFEPGT
jgi:hypothetical protein